MKDHQTDYQKALCKQLQDISLHCSVANEQTLKLAVALIEAQAERIETFEENLQKQKELKKQETSTTPWPYIQLTLLSTQNPLPVVVVNSTQIKYMSALPSGGSFIDFGGDQHLLHVAQSVEEILNLIRYAQQ